jgi:hypothetical protein
MSQDRPPLIELLSTVREFVESLAPRLSADARFQARIATYVLEICEREIKAGDEADTRWREALVNFLAVDPKAETQHLAAELSCRIRAGECDGQWEQTMRLLLRHAVDQVSIVRPDHLARMHLL